ncbi:NmrA family NAD(P)-binding protein [Streptosporangium sp. NPDC023615]|uniref:NmrA family NAD(P)-binding protein n=1 Tax=Streptosporangium sp. NPDC023615 TaxID=3154794 RepID=UPI003422ADA5
MTDDTTLVIGGTGKTGSRVLSRLQALGVPVRNGSRSASPAFDWSEPATWGPALEGVRSAYIAFYPDLAFPWAAESIGGLTAIAAEKGVRRLVLLSGRGEDEARVSEDIVRNSGLEWTILRADWFFQNFSEGMLLEPVLGGTVAFVGGDVAEPFVDAVDIAECAVAALTEDTHVGQVYELSGPRAMTFAEVAAEISQAAGREVSYVPVTPEQYSALLVEHGEPKEVADQLATIFAQLLDGRNAAPTDDVRRILGREPRDFADFAKEVAPAWQV